ncbi:MAG: response regulator, partial [Thermoplasmata archaeon]|nr:response regulator [Thermoplasmata archaeon]NIY04066.1 response regulator [Thermoplasmata archaeon]
VVLIDPDPHVCEMLRGILSAEGHSVWVAGNGAQGLEAARALPCDVALIGPPLPDMDSLEAITTLKESVPQAQAIALTEFSSLGWAIEAMRRGAFGYLLKPIYPGLSLLTIERALERKRLWEENRQMGRELKKALSELSHMQEIAA